MTVADKILSRLGAPMTIAGQQLIVTTSIGITIIPNDSVQPNILMKNADLAMYRAKDRHGNNYQYFAEEMTAKAHSRLRTATESSTTRTLSGSIRGGVIGHLGWRWPAAPPPGW